MIVGVGNADFGKVMYLDADDRVLANSKGKRAMRDIVQFVPFRNFVLPDGSYNSELLAREVLAEIPSQLCEYMAKNNIKPRPPRQFQQTQDYVSPPPSAGPSGAPPAYPPSY